MSDRPPQRYQCPECGAGSPSKRWMPVPHADDCPNLPANRAELDEQKRQAPKRLDPLTDATVAAAVLLGVYLADHDVPIIQQARDHLMAGLNAVSKP